MRLKSGTVLTLLGLGSFLFLMGRAACLGHFTLYTFIWYTLILSLVLSGNWIGLLYQACREHRGVVRERNELLAMRDYATKCTKAETRRECLTEIKKVIDRYHAEADRVMQPQYEDFAVGAAACAEAIERLAPEASRVQNNLSLQDLQVMTLGVPLA